MKQPVDRPRSIVAPMCADGVSHYVVRVFLNGGKLGPHLRAVGRDLELTQSGICMRMRHASYLYTVSGTTHTCSSNVHVHVAPGRLKRTPNWPCNVYTFLR